MFKTVYNTYVHTVYIRFLKLNKYTEGEMTIAQGIQCFTCALSRKFLNYIWWSHRTL